MTIESEGTARKKSALVSFSLFFLVALSSLAAAQESSRLEVFGGYSYKRFDAPSLGIADYANLNGWNGGATGNITRKWGVTLDLSGHYGSELTVYNFMIGPQYAWRGEKSKVFIHGLFGKAQNRVNIVELTRNGFESVGKAIAGGGGFDYDWSPRISIRVFQADYIHSNTFGTTQNDIRVSTGLIFNFGHIGHRRRL